MSIYLYISICIYLHKSISISIYAAVSIYIYIYTENGNLRLFAPNGRRKFIFLGRQTINGNRHLLFQQTYPSMAIICTCNLFTLLTKVQNLLRTYFYL